MKTRQGFVSNSSSSSFIIAFDKKPESAKELQTLMFDSTEKTLAHPYNEGVFYATSKIAKTVFEDIQSAKPITAKELKELSREFPVLTTDKFKGKKIFRLEYGDECGEYNGALEHGDIFYKLPHVTISNH